MVEYKPTSHLEAIDAHLRDNDAKHSPVIVTILTVLRSLVEPADREPDYKGPAPGSSADVNFQSARTGDIGSTI